MAVIGYDFYINGVKDNSTPQPATYTFSGLQSATAYNITAIAIDGAGNRSAQSPVLTASTLAVAPPPLESPLSAPDMAAVDAFITPLLYPNQTTPGVIISITGPRGYYKKAYGYNAPGVSGGIDGRPLTTDDHFRMGSITKTFTAMAFWQAVDDGLVHLSDTLETYVPGVPNGTTLTLEQIITMRSGVYEYTSNLGVLLNILLNPAGPYSQAQALALIKGNASTFAPGSKYTYENSNAILIRAVVEAVRPGRTFPDILQQDIFDPLGLTETKWPTDPNIPAPAMSTGQFNPELAGAAGALTSTIGDLTKWAKAMRDGALLTPATWNLWTGTFPSTVANPGTHPPNNFRYGHFLASFGSWMGHDGSVANYGSACVFDTISGATVSVVTNLATSDAFYKIFRNIAALLYPSSVLDQNLSAKTVRPAPVALTLTGGTPFNSNRVVTPTGVVLTLTGGASPRIATPDAATLSVTGGTPNVTKTAALSFINANASNSETVTIPAHQVGDIIVIFAFADGFDSGMAKPSPGGTVPAWVDIDANFGANQCHSRTAYFVATATNHTSGTWTGGSFGNKMIAVVLRNQKAASPIGGHTESGGTALNGAVAPAVTMSQTDGSSMLLHFFGRRSSDATAWSAAPSGYTQRAAIMWGPGVCLDTKNTTTSGGAVTNASDGSSSIGYRGATVEIRAY